MPEHESIAEKSTVAALRTVQPAPAIAATPANATGAVLQMQRVYGNRCVQRMLQLARQGEGERGVPDEVEASIQAARGGGQALDRAVRAQLEPALGADFGGVRVHADRRADGLSEALGARAFTTGKDIFFRQGEYNPGSGRGRELLAHELTHVVQQNGGAVQTKLTVNAPGDQYEEEADRVARAVMQQEQQLDHLGEMKAPSTRKSANLSPLHGGADDPMHRPGEEDQRSDEAPKPERQESPVQRKPLGAERVQCQGWEIAGAAIGAASFVASVLPAGSGGFNLTNSQFRYSRDQAGPNPIAERTYTILHVSSTKGLGASFAFLQLVLRYDGHNIISAYTEADMISGYDGVVCGSEAQVTLGAVQASGPTQPLTQAYLLIEGFNNPSGPGFQRFTGRILITGDGRVTPAGGRLTDGTGYMRPWLHGFTLDWD